MRPLPATACCCLLQVPVASGVVDAGPKFTWKEALKPRNAITVPNPTTLQYSAGSGAYTGKISSISSPVYFQESAVELTTDVLLALPHTFASSVAADLLPTVDGRAQQAPPPLQCDKVTPAAAKLICQHRADALTRLDRAHRIVGTARAHPVGALSAPVQHQVAGTAAAASPMYRRKPQTPPAYNHDQGASGGSGQDAGSYYPPKPDVQMVQDYYPNGPSKTPFLPDKYPKDDAGIAFIPQTVRTWVRLSLVLVVVCCVLA